MKRIIASVGLLLSITVVAQPVSAQQDDALMPKFSYIEASGCEGLFLYAWNEGRSEVLTMRVDRNVVKVVDGTTTLNLATAGEGVAVRIEMTGARRGTMPYCSEAGQSTDERPAIWVAKAGTAKLMLRRRASAPVTPVSVTIERLVLASPQGTETRVKRTIRFTAAVADLTP